MKLNRTERQTVTTSAIKRSALPRWQNILVISITLIYLICELAFNSRLLDIVGGIASNVQVHNMERYGRSLTAIAAALLVLQFSLAYLARLKSAAIALPPFVAPLGVLMLCATAAGLTWHGVERFMEHQVTQSNANFRQTAMLAQLYQHSLINGNQVLQGVAFDADGTQSETWNSPAGKAFLAMLPVLLSSVERYHTLLSSGAEQNLRDSLLSREGGVRGYYSAWLKARQAVREQYDDYYNDRVDLSDAIAREQHLAWERYNRALSRNRLSPWNVPSRYYNRVRSQVRQQGVPVPADWQPSDRATFNDAVKKQVWKSYYARPDVKFHGTTIPKRLNWDRFFALDVVQKSLRQTLALPDTVTLLPQYPLDDSLKTFVVKVQIPHLDHLVRQQLPQLRASFESFAAGGKNERQGENAARAILVPPMALFFSLCGALTHLTKLLYLIIVQLSPGLALRWPRAGFGFLNRHPLACPLGVVILLVGCFGLMNNAITASPMYTAFRHALEDTTVSITGEPLPLSGGKLLRIVHIVSIGQSYTYPFNEFLRTHLLGGFDFGYSPHVSE